MSLLCNQCECVNVNGVRVHEGGCPNQYEQIRLLDDGTLDTVFDCGACNEQFRFNFTCELIHEGEADGSGFGRCDNGTNEACYEDFKLQCLRELQDEHDCPKGYSVEDDDDITCEMGLCGPDCENCEEDDDEE